MTSCQAKRTRADFDCVCGNSAQQRNLTKTTFMRNGGVSDAPFLLNGTNTFECSSYVNMGPEVNMSNGVAPELEREIVKKTKDIRLHASLFYSTALPARTYVLRLDLRYMEAG
ncbi:unnamed protein product [Heligmosomoides polygyrus]|uniref:Laminin N-terminal domain-containing protein n=1 Tax=Heligmosomoides polygyrus TaxID=6339 RepID=A0A183GA14_HELPZ|nr:unnamed protein product [Heligmosomoides polygyrus]